MTVENVIEWAQTIEGQRILMQHFVSSKVVGSVEKSNGTTGSLIVFTETFPVEDGGVFYYPHSSYDIFNDKGKFVIYVSNHLGENDENPTKASLLPGSYLIRTEIGGKLQEFFVTIESGKTTVVDVNELSGKDLSAEKALETDDLEVRGKFRFLKRYGDIRIRVEEDIRPSGERFRGRYRIRAGMNAIINPNLKLDIRFVSTDNPDDPNSSHVNLNDGFNQVQIAIDRAYVKWNPQKFNRFHLWLGKFSNPFENSSVYSELVWDADIQVEGSAFAFKYKNLGKFKEVLLYVLNKVGSKPNIGETVLYKLLYFIDFDFYEKYEERLIGASYIKNHYGPTPAEFKEIIDDIGGGVLDVIKEPIYELVSTITDQFPLDELLPTEELSEFERARLWHAEVESKIGALQSGNGLVRCRDRGDVGYQRYVMLAAVARNLQTLGKLLLDQSRKRRQKRKAG